jgi:hypothetical protein
VLICVATLQVCSEARPCSWPGKPRWLAWPPVREYTRRTQLQLYRGSSERRGGRAAASDELSGLRRRSSCTSAKRGRGVRWQCGLR